MSMIKGKIETDREIAPKEINFGRNLVHLDKNGKWTSNDPGFEIVESDLGTLMDEQNEEDSEVSPLKKSAISSEATL